MATKIPEQVIEEIRSQANIVDIIGQFVDLKKKGKNFFGFCPFHEERSPSFSVTEEKQFFKCFSCLRGGSVFNFLMEYENIDFPKAVAEVAKFAHIPFDEKYLQNAGSEIKQDSQAQQLITMHEDAVTLYHHILLNTVTGEPALSYLLERGMTKELIENFKIGFAPNEPILEPYFSDKKIDYQVQRASGLFNENDEGKLRDRFFSRIMFPIRNEHGQTIAFSGRILSTKATDKAPKYLNSPETKIFNKRNVLFNFDKARGIIRKEGFVVLYEGFMDVISAYQAGIQNGVASMGTSLTNEQIYLLERTTHAITINYDGDRPGQDATKRAVDLFIDKTKFEVSIVTLPEELDPDEYIRKYGSESYCSRVNQGADTATMFLLNYYRQDYHLDNERDRLDYIQKALNLLAGIQSPVEQELYLGQLANEFQIQNATLRQQMQAQVKQNRIQKLTSNHSSPQEDWENYAQEPPIEMLPSAPLQQPIELVERAEQMLFKRLMENSVVRQKFFDDLSFAFVDEKYQQLYLLFQGFMQTRESWHLASFMDFCHDEILKNLAMTIDAIALPIESGQEEIADYLTVITHHSPLQKELAKKQQELKEAKRVGDKVLEANLTLEVIELMKALKS